jgi:hypothetical protein
MSQMFYRSVVILFLLSFVASVGVASQEERQFSGAINGTIRIRMKLTQTGNTLRGTYLYEKVGKDIQLNGSLNGQQFILKETDAEGNHTGTFKGRFSGSNQIEGTWSSADGIRNFPFRLSAAAAAALPAASSGDGFSGEYARLDARGRIDKVSGATLNVRLLKDGSVEIQGDAFLVVDAKRGNVRTGNVEGTYRLKGNRLTVKGEGQYDCSLSISFGKERLEISDDNNQCGGLGVNFDGTYKRLGPPKLQ